MRPEHGERALARMQAPRGLAPPAGLRAHVPVEHHRPVGGVHPFRGTLDLARVEQIRVLGATFFAECATSTTPHARRFASRLSAPRNARTWRAEFESPTNAESAGSMTTSRACDAHLSLPARPAGAGAARIRASAWIAARRGSTQPEAITPPPRAAPGFVSNHRRRSRGSRPPGSESGARDRIATRRLARERARREPRVELGFEPAQKFRARRPWARERAVRGPFPHRCRRDREPLGHLADRQCSVHGTPPQIAHHLGASSNVSECERRGEGQISVFLSHGESTGEWCARPGPASCGESGESGGERVRRRQGAVRPLKSACASRGRGVQRARTAPRAAPVSRLGQPPGASCRAPRRRP